MILKVFLWSIANKALSLTTPLPRRGRLGGGSLVLLFFATFLCMSCSEKEEVDEYAGWKERNEQYVDSIAALARSGTDGWTLYKSYSMGDQVEGDAPNEYYVYVKMLEAGDGTYHPHYNDSVRVHYSGYLLPTESYPQGYNFDHSYSGTTLNVKTDVPTIFSLNGLTLGFATALMHSVQGDHISIVVPAYLGYGTSVKGSIPAHSTLLFDIHVARIYRYGIDHNTGWQ